MMSSRSNDDVNQTTSLMSDVSFSRRRRPLCGPSNSNRRSCHFKMLLISLSLCTSRSTALMSPQQYNTQLIRNAHLSTFTPICQDVSTHYDRQRRGKGLMSNAKESLEDLYNDNEDEDDDNIDYEDDTDTNQYLEHLISDAMKEERLTSSPNLHTNQAKPATAGISDKDVSFEETKRMMEQQQQQIDLLMKLVQNQQQPHQQPASAGSIAPQSPIEVKPEKTFNVTPLKIMFFIDGTWLYYSLHARKMDRCTVSRKFGKGWQAKYKVDWQALPRLICDEIEKQRGGKKSFKVSDRPLDISRVSVFTSAKKDTDPNSIRMRMFRDMATANYDVHMMETIGRGEKCVDIQLAVEMLHYATVPNAFDMAVILTGDKDFVPALVRTRQKGKELVICSMKSGCNRVLYESPHIRDYDVVWLENILDKFIIPIPDQERNRLNRAEYASAFTMMRVIRDYVEAAPKGMDFVSSRDIGKYLKSVKIADSDMLDELKQTHGGLWHFLQDRAKHLFEVRIPEDLDDHSFEVGVLDNSDEILVEEFKRNQYFTKEEKAFLEKYRKPTEAVYAHTEYTNEDDESDLTEIAPMPDYSSMKVVELKELCKEKNLPTSGKKDALVERLEGSYREYQQLVHASAEKKRLEWQEAPRKSIARMSGPSNVYSSTLPQLDVMQSKKVSVREDSKVSAYLEGLVKEYLAASGGVASSRDVGRYLAANKDSRNEHKSALAELKDTFGSLLTFLHSRDAFDVDNKISDSRVKTNGFPVRLIKR